MTFGDNSISIQKAVPDDIDQIKQIADAHRKELGFVRKPSLLEAISRSELIVARQNGHIVGFVEYRHRLDEQTTLYNIVVNSALRGQGIGRQLVQALIDDSSNIGKTHITLKCPEELEANKFYAALNFQLCTVEPGKLRRLNIWQWKLC